MLNAETYIEFISYTNMHSGYILCMCIHAILIIRMTAQNMFNTYVSSWLAIIFIFLHINIQFHSVLCTTERYMLVCSLLTRMAMDISKHYMTFLFHPCFTILILAELFIFSCLSVHTRARTSRNSLFLLFTFSCLFTRDIFIQTVYSYHYVTQCWGNK